MFLFVTGDIVNIARIFLSLNNCVTKRLALAGSLDKPLLVAFQNKASQNASGVGSSVYANSV